LDIVLIFVSWYLRLIKEFFKLFNRSRKPLSDEFVGDSDDRGYFFIGSFVDEFEIDNIFACIIKLLHCVLYLFKFKIIFQKFGEVNIISKRIFEMLSIFVRLQVSERCVSIFFEKIFESVFKYRPEICIKWLIFFVWFDCLPKLHIKIWDNIFGILFCKEIICIDITEKHINGLQIELVECVLVLLFQLFYIFSLKINHGGRWWNKRLQFTRYARVINFV